jgi:ADP-ribose pyrophosphatase
MHDPRNTDDAWMETEVRHFHLDDKLAAQLPLEAGDDAQDVAWADITPEMRLYASHKDWVDVVCHRSRSCAFGK